MSKLDKKCIECGDNHARKARARDIYLCSSCNKLDKYKLISKTQIGKEYFINEDELVNCNFYIATQGGYQNATLYILSDVKDVFCKKNDIDRSNNEAINYKITELKGIIENKLLKRQINSEERKRVASEKRREKLVKALKEYKLVLRTDSKLCNGYISGVIKNVKINDIVNRMCEMKYLYDYCDMNNCCDEAYEEQQEEYNAGYFPDCTVFEQAEYIALKRYGTYPDIWPWLQ